MGRQYRKNRRASKQSGGVPQQVLIIIVTFMLGYFTASVMSVGNLAHWVNTQILESQGRKHVPNVETQHARVPPKPKFEFYTLLANEKSATAASQAAVAKPTPTHTVSAAVTAANTATHPAFGSHEATTQSTPVKVVTAESKTTPLTHTAKPSKGTFLVQVASFKARPDADHMKGMLILKGFNVTVVPISHQTKGIWYRVVVGPYANRNLAQKAQDLLVRQEHLRGMVIAGLS